MGLKKYSLFGAFILLVGALIFSGCGKDTNKDTLKVGAMSYAESLEPTENYFSWGIVRYGIGENLVKFDDSMKPQPWIASSWSVGDDHKTWTFSINDKVKFSNGRKVTAQAVKESLERTFEKSKRAKSFFAYDSMEANGQTLTIHTDKVYPNLPGLLGDPLFLIKARIELDKNENYWDGDVGFKHVVVDSINDVNTRAMALQAGDIDMAVNIAAGEYGLFKDNKDYIIEETPSLRVVMVRMNHNGYLSDINVRRALVAGADRENYATKLFKDTFVAGRTPLPPCLNYGYNDIKIPETYNPERAKMLLAQSGWVDSDGDGYVDKDGKKLRLNFYTYTARPEVILYAEALQVDYKKIGVDVNVEIVDSSVVDKVTRSGDYDLAITSVSTASTGSPVWFLKQYWGTNIDGSNPTNVSGFSNPKYDELLALAETTVDDTQRYNAIVEAQKILLDDSASLFLGYPKINMIGKSYLKGIHTSPSEYYVITKDLKKE